MPETPLASSHSIPAALADRLLKITSLGGISQDDLTGTNQPTVYAVEIDATQNPGEQVYLRIYDIDAPTVGTTEAEMLLFCPKGVKRTYYMPWGVILGADENGDGLSVACVTNPGAVSGADSPTGQVNVKIAVKD